MAEIIGTASAYQGAVGGYSLNTPIPTAGVNPNGPAGGALTGTYPNPGLAAAGVVAALPITQKIVNTVYNVGTSPNVTMGVSAGAINSAVLTVNAQAFSITGGGGTPACALVGVTLKFSTDITVAGSVTTFTVNFRNIMLGVASPFIPVWSSQLNMPTGLLGMCQWNTGAVQAATVTWVDNNSFTLAIGVPSGLQGNGSLSFQYLGTQIV